MHLHITEKEKKRATIFLDILIIIVGTAVSAVALNMLTIPSGLLAGGTTGIAQFINFFNPINVGVFFFLLNIPLMIAAYIFLGKKFSIYTIIAITLVSSFLYIFPVQHIWTENILLAAIFGGVLNGIGCGIVLRRGGSQGGIDIVSRIVAKYSNISVGKVNLVVNVTIVIASGFLFGSEIALYTIISMFTSMKTYDSVLSHVNRVTILIVTELGEEVNTAINEELHRGTTMWQATGGYTHHEKTVLLCVAVKGQVTQLKKIVKNVDSHAFVSVISTQNVIGRFKQIW
jgi:uncharacterized membrane-anchored protein YitT (DUF2179 family)